MLPPFATLGADDSRELERFAGMTPEERLALLMELCDLTDSIVSAQVAEDALREPTRRSEASLTLWRSLVRSAHDD